MGLDRLQAEQMIDYVVNRSFRCSLLVGPDVGDVPRLNARALDELCVKPVLVPDGLPDLDPEVGRFRTSAGVSVTLRSETLVAFSRALATRNGSFTPFPRILVDAQKLAGRTFSEAEVSRLREDLVSLLVRRQLEFSAVESTAPARLPARPRLTPLNYAAARHRSIVVTASHQVSRINQLEQAICAQLDGSCHVEKLLRDTLNDASRERAVSFLEALRNSGCFTTEG